MNKNHAHTHAHITKRHERTNKQLNKRHARERVHTNVRAGERAHKIATAQLCVVGVDAAAADAAADEVDDAAAAGACAFGCSNIISILHTRYKKNYTT